MKTITYMRKVEVETTINHPTITFKPEHVRISTGDSSWNDMGYVPYLDGLTRHEYGKLHAMNYRVVDKLLEAYVMETFNRKHGTGSVDWYVYSAKDLNMAPLPKVDPKWNDDHADLVNMFKGL